MSWSEYCHVKGLEGWASHKKAKNRTSDTAWFLTSLPLTGRNRMSVCVDLTNFHESKCDLRISLCFGGRSRKKCLEH